MAEVLEVKTPICQLKIHNNAKQILNMYFYNNDDNIRLRSRFSP